MEKWRNGKNFKFETVNAWTVNNTNGFLFCYVCICLWTWSCVIVNDEKCTKKISRLSKNCEMAAASLQVDCNYKLMRNSTKKQTIIIIYFYCDFLFFEEILIVLEQWGGVVCSRLFFCCYFCQFQNSFCFIYHSAKFISELSKRHIDHWIFKLQEDNRCVSRGQMNR